MPLDQDEDPGPIPPLTQHRKFYPQLFRRALSDQQQQFYKQHGHLLLLKTLQLEIKTELPECQQLWEQFSPHQSLFDSWQFRLAFWHGYQFQPYFIVLKNQTGVLGVLPLWFNSELKQYEWFGSPWHEDNRFFVSDPVIIPLLLAAAPTPTILNAIATSAIFPYEKVISFQPDEPKYLIDLTKVASLDDFLDSLKKKKKIQSPP